MDESVLIDQRKRLRPSDNHVAVKWWNRGRRRAMVIGLDCAEPELVFERWLDRLPNIRSVIQQGAYGPLRVMRPADHRTGMGRHDVFQEARYARRLWLS